MNKKQQRIVAFIGLKGSGKDSLCEYLQTQYSIENIKFAQGIIEIISHYFDVPSVEFNCPNKEQFYFRDRFSIRDLMIFIGNGFRRYKPDIWIQNTINEIEDLPLNATLVITDARFPNEIKAIKDRGGIIVDIFNDELFQLEKKIVELLGNNWFSRSLIFFFNPGLAHSSEWYYFQHKKQANYHINNTNYEQGQQEILSVFRQILDQFEVREHKNLRFKAISADTGNVDFYSNIETTDLSQVNKSKIADLEQRVKALEETVTILSNAGLDQGK